LTPTDNHVIDQHVFRSPALIVTDKEQTLVLIPDLEIMKKGTPVRWYLDLNAATNRLTLGMSNSRVTDHVLFERTMGAEYPKGVVEIGFYLLHDEEEGCRMNPFRMPLDFIWSNWGGEAYRSGNPVSGDLEPYIKHTYVCVSFRLMMRLKAASMVSVMLGTAHIKKSDVSRIKGKIIPAGTRRCFSTFEFICFSYQ
jgi:hypothetical protein